MKQLKDQLSKGELDKLYLFTGEEIYLMNTYKERVKDYLFNSDDDMMNYNYFEGKQVTANEIIDICDTMPFFKEYRLVMVENSGMFKTGKKDESDKLADYLKNKPDTTYLIFIESEIDKRNKLYKALKKEGTITEFAKLTEQDIIKWLNIKSKKNKKAVNPNVLMHFVQSVGIDMENVEKEFEKLLCYTYDKDNITNEDIDEVCVVVLENKIFEMMDYISEKKQEKALLMYHNLITLKEPPLRIMYMLVRQFRLLLQVKSCMGKGMNSYDIANAIGSRKFIVDKLSRQVKHFSEKVLKRALYDCVDIEEKIKTGKMNDRMGVELIIIKYSS